MSKYLINTSFHADLGVADALRADVAANLASLANMSGLFSEPLMANILVKADENVESFTLQFKAADLDAAMRWFAPEGVGGQYLASLTAKYGQRIAFFTTPMEII